MKSMRWNKREMGQLGEQTAADYLQQLGYRIIERNWRCRTGEIDLIVEHQEQLIFIEVRTRSSAASFGAALESVNVRKQKQVRQTALVFIHMKHWHHMQMRFDAITVQLDQNQVFSVTNHIRNAF